jgi:hypothetical protein
MEEGRYIVDYEKVARELTPAQFELLIRAYCRQQAARMRTVEGQEGTDVTFGLSLRVGRDQISGRWRVCYSYEEDTKGEVLAPTVRECMRRHGWSVSPEATLLQIEGSAD